MRHQKEQRLARAVCARAQGANDCGAVCVAFIAARMGRKVSLAALRLACGTSPAGTTALGLLDGGRLAGLSGKGYRLEAGEIGQVPVPAVLHVRTAEDVPHYVVLLGVEPNGGLRLMDPARGALARCSREEFVKRFLGVALVFAPAEDGALAAGVRPGRSPWRRLLGLLRPHRRLVLQSFVGAVMMTILGLATAFFVEQLIDRVLPQGDRRLLMLLGFGMVAVLLVRAAMGWLQGRLALRLAEEVDASLVAGYYRHLMRLPQSFFQSMRVGEMVARVGDAVMVREFLTSTLVGLILNPLVIIFSLGVLFLYSWKLAVLALAMLPVFGVLQWLNHQLQGRHQRTLFERGAELEAQMVSSLQGRTLIRDNGLEGDTTLEQENHLVRLLRGVWGAGKSQLAVGTAGLLLTQGFILALLWWGGLLALRGEITPGELMSAFALAGYLAGPMSTLLGLGVNVQEALVGTERLYEILDLEAERDTGTAVLTRELASRDLRLEGVSVRPPGAGPILRQVSAVFPAGRVTALAGPSGCGKSTILGLLQRLHEPSEGRLFVGGAEISLFTRESLRAALAVVPQKVELQRGTILANLAPGVAQPDVERLVALCRETGLMDFVDRQPQGLLTPLMEGAPNLSGGQRQKVAIVRALYRDAPIVLLDEPSSALDAEAEGAIVALLERLREKGRTVVLAAHSRRLLTAADQVLHLDDGRLREVEVRDAELAGPITADMHTFLPS